MLGGIEAGGTKFVCAAGQRDGTIMDRAEFPTGEPDDTLRQVIRYFKDFPIDAIGIGSFGRLISVPTVKHTGASPRRRRQPGGTALFFKRSKALWIFPQASPPTLMRRRLEKLLSARPKTRTAASI